MMKYFKSMFLAGLIYVPAASAATATAAVSPTGSILKMVLGLAAVLAVMALVSWGVKRMMPGVTGQQSGVRVIGGVSVGSRERVVVLEVAGRWLVVGVAPGQVNGIANLEVGEQVGLTSYTQHGEQAANAIPQQFSVHPMMQPLVKPFSEWLKKSAEKATANRNPHAKE